MLSLDEIRKRLKEYDGIPVSFMEVCGTHTGEIARNGIVSMLSPKIRLVSGPGCPVCVTVASYIDRLLKLSCRERTCVVSFGDLFRVKGSRLCLNDIRGRGGRAEMVYAPENIISLAEKEPETEFIFAAVGFETTAAVYADLMERLIAFKIRNIKLLTALKVMPPAIQWVCENGSGIDGFIAPGNVSVVTGSGIYRPLSERFGIPFAVAGFAGEELLIAVYGLLKNIGKPKVMNYYPYAVTEEGNRTAQKKIAAYFEPCAAAWRGLGMIADSGLKLKREYACFDAGSESLCEDAQYNPSCRCAEVLVGKISPTQCPLFGTVCQPQNPQGACMVSAEGSCHNWFVNRRKR
ncbi:hydrogenase formation protein HypD [Acetivibrio sp. MSJd-27]|uniref:hydrogenase formation protein HypD n=1 Tax=Acetivibrio sp. MSJd-27 TaxID=2841523 RepID=UPI00209EC0D3|nr:hydrogenase formation protein HypD [Acetivibrio sp. MSJd-27]